MANSIVFWVLIRASRALFNHGPRGSDADPWPAKPVAWYRDLRSPIGVGGSRVGYGGVLCGFWFSLIVNDGCLGMLGNIRTALPMPRYY